VNEVIRYLTFGIGVAAVLFILVSDGRAVEESHARIQLTAMLQDRPQLAATLEARSSVREWILARFQETEPPLAWDRTPPISNRAAELDARDSTVTLLRLDGASSGIDQLVYLLFELHNVQGYDAFESIHEEAVRGEITREEYASRMLKQEFRALLAARVFYRDHLSDLSRTEEREARAYYRMRHGTNSFEEHVGESRERGYDLLDHYRVLYDNVVIPERNQRQQTENEGSGTPGGSSKYP
jgi:hypothetical protein